MRLSSASWAASRVRQLFWAALALGILFPAQAQQGEPTGQTRPRLELESNVIDLGRVYRGDVAEARFVLRNNGDREVKILRAKPG